MTTPTISIVVPTRNSGRTIRACLQSIREQSGVAMQLIVVDNNSTDDTPDIGRELADVFLTAGPERSAQRNIGMSVAAAPVIGFIDSDMELESDVSHEAIAALAQQDVRGVVVAEYSVGEGYLARCRALEKQIYIGDPDVEAARFFRTDEVRSLGGYDASLPPGGEDWDLSDRMLAEGGRHARTDSQIRHDDGRVVLRDAFSKKRYYGRGLAEFLDEPSHSKRRLLRPTTLRRSKLLLRAPLVGAGVIVLKAVEVSGLALGIRDSRRARA